MNDGACDPAGRFWAGSMALQEDVLGAGALYRLEPDGSAVEVLAGVSLSNGIAWSPDGRTMYHVDTSARTLSAYSFAVLTGALGPRASADRLRGPRRISGRSCRRRRGVHLGRLLARVPRLSLLARRRAARRRRGSRRRSSRVAPSAAPHSKTSTSRPQHAISIRLRPERAICTSPAQACRGGSHTDSEGDHSSSIRRDALGPVSGCRAPLARQGHEFARPGYGEVRREHRDGDRRDLQRADLGREGWRAGSARTGRRRAPPEARRTSL